MSGQGRDADVRYWRGAVLLRAAKEWPWLAGREFDQQSCYRDPRGQAHGANSYDPLCQPFDFVAEAH